MMDLLIKYINSSTQTFLWFVQSLVNLQVVADDNEALYNSLVTRKKYGGQKMVMQKALNEIFGQAVNYIYIVTNQDADETLSFFNSSELNPIYFFNSAELLPVYVINDGEISSGSVNFIVYVPVAFYSAENDRRIKSEVERLKVAGTQFKTQSV